MTLRSCIQAGVLLLLGLGVLLALPSISRSQSDGSGYLVGYAWSDNTGWISLSCANDNSCTDVNYGFFVASDGTVTGYGWSDNVGWVSAQTADITGCPVSPCTPTLTEDALTGWFKALAGGTAQSGGWDGWIRLSGPSYGVIRTGDDLSGYAWGSDVMGWVDMSLASFTETPGLFEGLCLEDEECDAGLPPTPKEPSGSLRAVPSLVRNGGSSTISWDILHATICTVTGTNGSEWEGDSGSESVTIAVQTFFTLNCTGPGGSLTQQAVVNILPIFQEQ